MSMRVLSKTAPVTRAYIRYASTESTTQKAGQVVPMPQAPSSGLTKSLCNLYKIVTGPLPAIVKGPLNKAVGIFEPILYYSEVVYHLGKQVVVRQNFTLPAKADFAAAETQLFKVLEFVKVKNIKSIKDIPVEQWKNGAIKTFELSALFVIGEIVGRQNLIGYKD
ncbi:mitochondrial ATP synthase g subunit-domain-containing protein [Kickxella alabastrina]|uniref:mitochondrial ATP synthase g subunit-domain-containing protein n=1 Tax=Kickxella alabastrina TaxID=61397 RepID=UPI002220F5FD|nr:mitochondrial ATP synthase g subunit-domain-containing protein [Kickxella alabastrina]KAI7831996.1 mitochondrial ATP synthase g subunit-domain-containing protein [Kickxella alabastrina]